MFFMKFNYLNKKIFPFLLSLSSIVACEDSVRRVDSLATGINDSFTSVVNSDMSFDSDQGRDLESPDYQIADSVMSDNLPGYCGDNSVESEFSEFLNIFSNFDNFTYNFVEVDSFQSNILRYLVSHNNEVSELTLNKSLSEDGSEIYRFYFDGFSSREFLLDITPFGNNGLKYRILNNSGIFFISSTDIDNERFKVPSCGLWNEFIIKYNKLLKNVGINPNNFIDNYLIEDFTPIQGCLINSADIDLNHFISNLNQLESIDLNSETTFVEFMNREVYLFNDSYVLYNLNQEFVRYVVCPMSNSDDSDVVNCEYFRYDLESFSYGNITYRQSGTAQNVKYVYNLNLDNSIVTSNQSFAKLHCSEDLLRYSSLLEKFDN